MDVDNDVEMEMQFVVLDISRADLETTGIDASKVDDETMEDLAAVVGGKCAKLMWEELQRIADVRVLHAREDDRFSLESGPTPPSR